MENPEKEFGLGPGRWSRRPLNHPASLEIVCPGHVARPSRLALQGAYFPNAALPMVLRAVNSVLMLIGGS